MRKKHPTRALAEILHSRTCASDCCDGGDHVDWFMAMAREVLAHTADDGFLHREFCPHYMHSYAVASGGGWSRPDCSDDVEHVARVAARMRELLGLPA